MSELSEINYTAYQWDGKNELFEEMLKGMNDFVEVETDTALDATLDANQRAYMCGKAAAVREVRDHFLALREMAVARKTGG